MNETRNKVIIRTSIIGIVANVFLCILKATIGILTHSIAITMDAVNNLSDSASSLITIIGAHLSTREPDRKHPFGYGRVEYFSSLVISILVLYAGITSLVESVKNIFHPQTPAYTTVALVIVAIGVVIKLLLGRFFVSTGKKVDSGSLIASGEDATLDSVISGSTLVAAIIYLFTHVSVESYLAAVISVVIIKSGIELLRETLSRLLGERADASQAAKIKETILQYPAVSGVYDLVLHDYGPDSYQGSVHIEVPDTYTANELDNLLREISLHVFATHHVILTAIGVYSINTRDEEAIRLRKEIHDLVFSHPHITQMHGFYWDKEKSSVRFDLVISFDAEDRKAEYQQILQEVQERYPDYTFTVTMDTDFA